jgi:hypothetical protein
VLVPGVAPSSHCVAAMPEAFVVAVAGETEPPPAVTTKVTVSFAIGAPFSSTTFTRTESPSARPAAPDSVVVSAWT